MLIPVQHIYFLDFRNHPSTKEQLQAGLGMVRTSYGFGWLVLDQTGMVNISTTPSKINLLDLDLYVHPKKTPMNHSFKIEHQKYTIGFMALRRFLLFQMSWLRTDLGGIALIFLKFGRTKNYYVIPIFIKLYSFIRVKNIGY